MSCKAAIVIPFTLQLFIFKGFLGDRCTHVRKGQGGGREGVREGGCEGGRV